jgi:hypothetical protein
MKNVFLKLKSIYIIVPFVVILILIFVLIFVFAMHKKEAIMTDIKSLNYSYSQGYAMNAYVRYELECKEKCILKYKPLYVPEEDFKKVEVNEEVVKELESILNKYEVYKWDGFNKSNKNVLDGDDFHFSVNLKDGTSISASGYMSWPKNYREVSDEISTLFNKLFE